MSRPDAAAQACVDSLLRMIQAADPPLAFADLACLVDSVEVGQQVVKLPQGSPYQVDSQVWRKAKTRDEREQDSVARSWPSKGDARVKVTTVHCYKEGLGVKRRSFCRSPAPRQQPNWRWLTLGSPG